MWLASGPKGICIAAGFNNKHVLGMGFGKNPDKDMAAESGGPRGILRSPDESCGILPNLDESSGLPN
eukprot:4663812-Pyramimonas_sp.AAC.1